MKSVLVLAMMVAALAFSPAAIPGAAAARSFSRRSLQQIPGRTTGLGLTKPWFGPSTGPSAAGNGPVAAVPLAATQPAVLPSQPVISSISTNPAVTSSLDGWQTADGGSSSDADAGADGGDITADTSGPAVPVTTGPAVLPVPAKPVPVTTVPVATGPVTTVPVATGPVTTVPVATGPVVNQPSAISQPALINDQTFYGGSAGQAQGGAQTAMNGPAYEDDGLFHASGVPGGVAQPLPGAGTGPAFGWNNNGNNKWGKKGNNWGGNGNGWGAGGNPWRGKPNKGNKQSLDPLVGSVGQYPTIRPQPIPINGPAGSLMQGIRTKGNARSAAQNLAQVYSSGQVDAAAQAIANAATSTTSADAAAVADVLTEAVKSHPTVAPGLLAKSANLAVTSGHTNAFAATMADAFSYAKQKNCVPAFTETVADAIATGGASSRYAFGEAISQAIAGGADSQAAVAEATAAAFCSGGDTASAWASAYAVALSKDSSGCLVLNQAKAMAQSTCANQMSQSYADAQATSLVLGFCGLLDMVNVNTNFAGGNSGSNTMNGLTPQYFNGGK